MNTKAAPTGLHRGLDTYMNEIGRTPLLSRDEEGALARRIREGDQEALDRLVSANLRFVVSVATKYANKGLPLEDLINDGNLGLVKAAQRFDERRGFKFISYAVWWIRQSILQSLADHSRIVRLPLNRAGLLYRIGRVKPELDQQLGRTPTAAEIAAKLEVTEEEVRETMKIANTHVSLDDPLSADDDSSLIDRLEDHRSPADTATFENALTDDIAKALATLPDRERRILTLYFGLEGREPMTLEAIGREIGLTRERIRQIKEVAIDRLRRSSRSSELKAYLEVN